MNLRAGKNHRIIMIQHPVLWVFAIAVLVCLLLFTMWATYDYGRYNAGYDSADSQRIISGLTRQLTVAKAKIVETQRQTSMLKRNKQIDDDVSGQLKQVLAQLQNKVVALKKDLAFYKSIVAPERGDRSVAIQSFQLTPAGTDQYQYKLMVSQRGRNDFFARGTITVVIAGTLNDKHVTLKLRNISNETKKILKFGFKYFQNFEGVMSLPTAFQPDSVRVRVEPRSSRIKPVDEQFAWSDLAAGGT